MKKRVIFSDRDIVRFCQATRDTNEVHDPQFMGNLGKRVIVPGMFAFSSAAALTSSYLKEGANRFVVFFHALLSSGDFADMVAAPEPGSTDRVRISAINHRDTLATNEEYTHLERSPEPFMPQTEGIIVSLDVTAGQVSDFAELTHASDPDLLGLLFAVAYASQALYYRIASAETEVEKEIDQLINGSGKVSPFYHRLEISLPEPFVPFVPGKPLRYRIHFERERRLRSYIANLQCEQESRILYKSVYKLVGIPDAIILRMAKNTK